MKFKVKYPVKAKKLEEVLNEIADTPGQGVWDIYPYDTVAFVVVYTINDVVYK